MATFNVKCNICENIGVHIGKKPPKEIWICPECIKKIKENERNAR